MEIGQTASFAGIFTVAVVMYLLYRYEFRLKRFVRTIKCKKRGHLWTTVYGYTQQCRHCHKVGEMSREILTK